MSFPGGSDGKKSACDAGYLGLIPGLRRFLGGEHGNSLQYSCLENPHGQRSLADYSPWGCTELDMSERLSAAQHRAMSVLVEMPIIRVLLATSGSAAEHVMGCQQFFLIHRRLVISTTWNTSRRKFN